ncbi:MAG: NAD(P)-dependent oxidoreductase, partial [Candidatus Pacebacteria bacterium]|nr:NAD(P)-dependent oxidoreductase [Candidatus Paceibacterota bacterium]
MSEKNPKKGMNLLYLFAERHPKNLRELIRSYIPQEEFEVREMSYLESTEDQIEKIKWAEAALLAPGRHLKDEVLASGGHLKLMQIWSSGYDKFNLKAATEAGIPVSNNGGANRIAVAEQTFLLMLSVYKRLPDSHRRVVTGNWEGNSHGMDMFILYGKTLGIVGLGAIGREVAVRAKAFGMKVLYYDIKRLSPKEEKEFGVEYAELERLYKESDVVTLHLNYTPEVENMISA